MADVLSRFRTLDGGLLRPGCCYTCRGTNGPFIDTGVSVDWEGALYICANCLIEMHRQLDLAPTPDQEAIEIIKMDSYAKGFDDSRAEFVERLNDFISSNSSINSDASNFSTPVASDSEDSAGVETNIAKSSGNNSKSRSRAKQVSGTSGEQGSNDISGDSSNGISVSDSGSVIDF